MCQCCGFNYFIQCGQSIGEIEVSDIDGDGVRIREIDVDNGLFDWFTEVVIVLVGVLI